MSDFIRMLQVRSSSPIHSWAYSPSIIGYSRIIHSHMSYHGIPMEIALSQRFFPRRDRLPRSRLHPQLLADAMFSAFLGHEHPVYPSPHVHSNFASFIRQLKRCDFHKVCPVLHYGRWLRLPDKHISLAYSDCVRLWSKYALLY